MHGSGKTAVQFGLATLAAALALTPAAHAGGGRTQAAQAAPASPAAAARPDAATEAAIKKGKELFANYSCGSCHALAAADAIGDIGPSLDKDDKLTTDLVIARVSQGSGPMPAFGGQLTPDEIKAVATYVVSAAAK